jgi:hypothetical protein
MPTYAHFTDPNLSKVLAVESSVPPKKALEAIKGAMNVPTPLKA